MKLNNKKLKNLFRFFKYRIEFGIAMGLVKLFLLFPEKKRFSFAETLGKLYFKFDKRRREISLANIALAFPEMKQEEKERIILKSYCIMFKAFISTIWFDTYLKEKGKVSIVNVESVKKGMDEYGSIISACMHMGNMEASLKIVDYYPVATIAKAQRNPLMDEFITKNRESIGIKLLKKSRSTASDLKKLMGQGYAFGIFADHRDKGANITFFGKETIAPTGAVSLAMRNNLPLYLSYNILNDDNTSTLYISDRIELLNTGNFKEDLNNNVQNLIYEMEKVILKYPEQWMWFHDRWNLSKTLKKSK